jgi:hypothetical protein
MDANQRDQKIQDTAKIISNLNDETEFNESVMKIIKDLGLDKPESNSQRNEEKVARQAEL